MNDFEKLNKDLDEDFEQKRLEAIKTGKSNWEYLERLLKEGNRNNARSILHAIECIVSEEKEFAFEKRKWHQIRNAMQKGYNLRENEK